MNLKQFSARRFRKFLVVGGIICLIYFFLDQDGRIGYRIVDGFFVGGMVPFLLGGVELVKHSGTFALLTYTHRKIWKNIKPHEKGQETDADGKAVSYSDYLREKEAEHSHAYLEPLAAGLMYLAASMIGTYMVI